MVTNHPSQYVSSSALTLMYMLTSCSDPDIQHLPFFAISPVFLNSLWSSYYKREMTFDAAGKLLISLQHKLFYVVLSLARFNLYANSFTYLVKTAFEPKKYRGGRWWWWAEIAGLGIFFAWFTAVLRGCGTWQKALVYLLVSHVAASPVHVQVGVAERRNSRSRTDAWPHDRSCSRTSRVPLQTSGPSSRSSHDNSARLSTSSARRASNSSMAGCTCR